MTTNHELLERRAKLSVSYSHNFATAKPDIGATEKEHILGLCVLVTDLAAALALSRGVPEGTWLWGKLMDWCRSQGTSPANFDSLFAIASEAHKLYAAPAAAGAQGEEYAACCDTPAYCSSVRRCTRMDTTPQPAAAAGGVRELPSVAAFASAMWRDWMTNEQADKLGAELHAWLSAHFATALSSHRQAGDHLSKFRELAEEWRAGVGIDLETRLQCADELIALVEKGAGNGQ